MGDSDNMSWNSGDEEVALGLPPRAAGEANGERRVAENAPVPPPRPAQPELPQDPPAPRGNNGLMDALARGVHNMNARQEEFVNFESSDDEFHQAPEEDDDGLEGQTEAHRRAVQSNELKKEQEKYRRELSEGASPARLIEIFPLLDTIRQQCMRDSVAKRYVEDINDVARQLIKVNTALKTELDPVSYA